MFSQLIRGGTVVSDTVAIRDVLVEGESIKAIGDLSHISADEIIDADGLLVLPGGVDTHVHFNDDFMGTVSVHDFFTGTQAAAFGGTTTVVDFSNQSPTGSLLETLQNKHNEAQGMAVIDWGVHPVITRPDKKTLNEIPLLIEQGAPSFKCYMTYREEGLMMEVSGLERILSRLKKTGGMLMLHAEDNTMAEAGVAQFLKAGKTDSIYHALSKPAECEEKAISSAIQIAEAAGGRVFIVHLSSPKGMVMIAEARSRGVDIHCETCTHYLLFTEDFLKRVDGVKWICSPPLRNQEVQNALWQGLFDGRIQMVTSDDAAFSWEAKLMGKNRFDKCPNGIPGVEVRLPLLYSEGVVKRGLSLSKFVDLVAAAPARFFGLVPHKGSLVPDADADIVLFDPNTKWVMNQKSLHMAADWSAFEGIEVTGKIQKVFSRGELVVDGDVLLAQKGRGRYIYRQL